MSMTKKRILLPFTVCTNDDVNLDFSDVIEAFWNDGLPFRLVGEDGTLQGEVVSEDVKDFPGGIPAVNNFNQVLCWLVSVATSGEVVTLTHRDNTTDASIVGKNGT